VELKDFVKETLSQISAGVAEAMDEVRENGGCVNPAAFAKVKVPEPSHFGAYEKGKNIFLVDFDVAVTATKESGTNAGAKLTVANFLSLGARGESSQNNVTVNRIAFKVPLVLPVDPESEAQMNERLENAAKKRAERKGFQRTSGFQQL
jgi:hypothetical protein